MSVIHVLDDTTINKIAAGEVVERPASVIKELVENSLDAGATRVEVEIMAGGTSFMRVTDNGRGMSAEDAKLALRRHATSKIKTADDLNMVDTLGFRGEALPTIASVSRFHLLTRPEDTEFATAVTVMGGKAPQLEEAGGNKGTTIKVEDLFFNTPARKKFLKTDHTEAGRINDMIVKIALSHPAVSFRFINNNKLSVTTPGNGSLFDAIQGIYGPLVGKSLLALDFTDRESDIRITGYITKPSMLKSSRGWQTLIVNGRVIGNKAVMKAIDNAYRSLIPKSGFPLVVLDIAVPQHTIDVNIHPRKSEVKFEDEGRIFKAVYKSVIDAIRPAGQMLQDVAGEVQKAGNHLTVTAEPMHFVPAADSGYSRPGAAGPLAARPRTIYEAVHHQEKPAVSLAEAQALRQLYEPDGAGDINNQEPVAGGTQAPATEVRETAAGALSADGTLLPIGQVDLTYIIAQDEKGLYIIDQHAAHERILFDKFSAMAEKIPSQQLLVQQFLDFDRREAELIDKHKELFASLGFSLEASGDNQIRLIEVPADIPVGEAEDIIREILTSLHDMHEANAQEIRQACLATTACRAAIKAGDELNFRQMQIILDELAHTARPYTCPHGRPTILKFSSDELAKMFKRTGF
jgi:DNA mismatch repair protein MutL